jgi:hypothetical protein
MIVSKKMTSIPRYNYSHQWNEISEPEGYSFLHRNSDKC